MTTQVTHHELLLLTNSLFAQRRFCEKDTFRSATSIELQLQRACWNGLVLELLPDVLETSPQKRCVYPWEVIPAENFIEVRLGKVPCSVEYNKSVNPYLFLFETNFN